MLYIVKLLQINCVYIKSLGGIDRLFSSFLFTVWRTSSTSQSILPNEATTGLEIQVYHRFIECFLLCKCTLCILDKIVDIQTQIFIFANNTINPDEDTGQCPENSSKKRKVIITCKMCFQSPRTCICFGLIKHFRN